MKKVIVVLAVISIVTLGLTATSFAQKGAMKWRGSADGDLEHLITGCMTLQR